MALALAFGTKESDALSILGHWEKGLWNPPLLVFALQMMLMLVLGHTLALSKPMERFIDNVTARIKSPADGVYWVTLLTLLVALFNWGLGLIFGAIMARKVGEKLTQLNVKFNYAILGAAGYSGLMVWHGGISGSAPVKVVEEGHISSLMSGIYAPQQMELLPSSISFAETIFSSMNLVTSLLLLIILPLAMRWLTQRNKTVVSLPDSYKTSNAEIGDYKGAEKLDHSRWLCLGFAILILIYAIYIPIQRSQGLGFITPNYINLCLFGLSLLLHQSFNKFLGGVDKAISGASGILIQFPLYFGIMGIMKSTGLITLISDFFISISNEHTFPIFTFFSAGLVNIFVPSGGGQWSIQGPIIIQAAQELGIPLSKSIMALAYGDQMTNMLQPFWALPLLGITGLKAKDILPYTLILLLLGLIIFITTLILF